jgi:N6-adenosine-specific RNA methylase IME4
VPRIELFAREQAPGWDAIGNEIDGRDIRDALNDILAGLDERIEPCPV